MYNIYQVKLSEAVYNFVNGPEGGHTKTADIVEDTSTGEFHMVDGMGFKQIETKSLEVA